jgi:hypothetical protein
MAAGYALDSAGARIHPAVLAAVAAGVLAAMFVTRPRVAPPERRVVATLLGALVAAGMLAYALWIASPSLLPVTNGPDVVHHLQLVHLIARTGRLPHDPALGGYLLEMMGYTPGAHILTAAVAAWLRVDPLRVVYPLAAVFVALQAGLLFTVTRRVSGTGGVAFGAAVAAPVLALAPAAYSIGAFVQFFYFGQVISQTFAVGMLAGSLAWIDSRRARDLVVVSLCAVGVVLAWPIWIGPSTIAVAAALLTVPSSFVARARRFVATMAPAAAVVALHQWAHPAAASILVSTGAVTAPSIAVFGAGFLAVAVAGAVLSAGDRRTRLVGVFLAAVLAQAAALALLSMRAGSSSFYMAFKTLYLAVPPAAVLGAWVLAWPASLLAARLPRAREFAVCLPLLVAVLLVRGRVPVHREHGWISMPAQDVGAWAAAHVPPACVDYFSRYWLTGYWLHLDVLGNPRVSDRMSHETFELRDAAATWIEGRGLPFAIVEDLPSIPRDVRVDMVPVYQSGRFALVRNLRPAACR